MRKLTVSLMTALLATGCTLEPKYDRPAAPVPGSFPQGEAYRAGAVVPTAGKAAADIGWREFFTDARLQRLIELTLANNRDLRVAALNVEAQRAQYRIQRSDLLPTISATATESAQSVPPYLNSAGLPIPSVIRQYTVGVGFTSYELDVFGRIRSLTHQQLEQYFGYEETRRSTQISLVAEVADDYLTLLSDQELLRITQDTLRSDTDSYDLTQRMLESGQDTELDLRQAESAVDTARANLAQYTRQVAQDRNALQLLLGAPLPEDLSDGPPLEAQSFLAELPAGVPSDLLERRPDILSAEHNLRAANANIGAARAAFFPSVSLTGLFGTSSMDLSGLFASGSRYWTFNPQLSLPIFAAGANVANLDLAKVQKSLQVAQYEKAIQTAFREVADALAARGTLLQQLEAQRALVTSAGASYKLSQMRFHSGVDAYLTVLDSQRTLYSAQQGLVSVELTRLENLVSLYKALGGGWAETDSRVAQRP
ncbi:MAG: multidrug transporter [Gammaproteobacteria bacterium]|nr:multidrug transporter [Gammaproteobacteria bacterium]